MKHFSIWLFPSNIVSVWKEHSVNLFDGAIFKDAFFFGNSMQTSISGILTKLRCLLHVSILLWQHLAAGNGHVECVSLLIQKGADVNKKGLFH